MVVLAIALTRGAPPGRVAGLLVAAGALLIGIAGPLVQAGSSNLVETVGAALLLVAGLRGERVCCRGVGTLANAHGHANSHSLTEESAPRAWKPAQRCGL